MEPVEQWREQGTSVIFTLSLFGSQKKKKKKNPLIFNLYFLERTVSFR